MPDPISAVIAGGAQLIGGFMQAEAAEDAANVQARAAVSGQETQRQMFERTQEILRPYVESGRAQLPTLGGYTQAGPQAFERQLDLAGLRGPQAQQAAIGQVQAQPRFGTLMRTGEEAILANASATGGLRGGNTQNALARFRSDLLANEIEREYARMGGLTAFGQGVSQNLAQLGQASGASGVAAGLQTGQGIANLQGAAGAAQAGGILGQAGAYGQVASLPMQALGMEYGLRRAGQPGFLSGLFNSGTSTNQTMSRSQALENNPAASELIFGTPQ
jgi:hypothetical protein